MEAREAKLEQSLPLFCLRLNTPKRLLLTLDPVSQNWTQRVIKKIYLDVEASENTKAAVAS